MGPGGGRDVRPAAARARALRSLDNRTAPVPGLTTLDEAVRAAERTAILAALSECNQHRERAARLLDISVRTLHYKMNRLGL